MGFEEKKKKKSRNNRREDSLAAIAELCTGSMPVQTRTPTPVRVFRSCRNQLLIPGMCAHMCLHTLSHGCVDPLGSSYRQHVYVNRCRHGCRVPRSSPTPAVGPTLSPALQGFAPRKDSSGYCAFYVSHSRGVLRSLSLNPARTNQVIKQQISLLTALSLMLPKICLLASSQACPSVHVCVPALPCHHL